MLELKGHTLLLASHSPRRRELLEGLGVPFRVVSVEADETYPASLTAGEIPLYIARAKARAYEERLQDKELLLGPFQGKVACTKIPEGKGVPRSVQPSSHTGGGSVSVVPLSPLK